MGATKEILRMKAKWLNIISYFIHFYLNYFFEE